MKCLVSENADLLFSHLRELVAIPSVFTRPDDVKKAMNYCKTAFKSTLPGYTFHEDEGQNLIGIPDTLNIEKPLLYLSAHVDTVGARPEEWDAPFAPFTPFETDEELVGRGVSDCKAGVAFQLFVAALSQKKAIALENIIFTLTFKEEGAGNKSAVHIGHAMGHDLPLSKAQTLLIVLENTVTTGPCPSLGLYTAEKGNFVIEVTGSLSELQASLTQLSRWNPICIHPEGEPDTWHEPLIQKGGHACSIPRNKNRLTEAILSASATDALAAGDPSSFGVIPTIIKRGKNSRPLAHTLILSNRSFDSLTSIQRQLGGIAYRELKAFAISPGMDIRDQFKGSIFEKAIESLVSPPLAVMLDHNTGISDASTIINTLDLDLSGRIFPVVMGPGTRSQRHTTPQRLTHGKNETFDKKSGLDATSTLFQILQTLNFIKKSGDR